MNEHPITRNHKKSTRSAKTRAHETNHKRLKPSTSPQTVPTKNLKIPAPCYTYTKKHIKTLESILSSSNGYEVKFKHYDGPTTHSDLRKMEEKIMLGPVSALQHHADTKCWGVFAKEDINLARNRNEDVLLGAYLGQHQSMEEVDADDNFDPRYTFELDNGDMINAKHERSWLAMVNSTSDKDVANIEPIESNDNVYYRLTRPIKQNQQLLVYYGDAYRFENKRFLNPNDTWEESDEKFQKNKAHYQDKQTLDPHFLKLLELPDNTVFAVPNATLTTFGENVVDIPLLAYDAAQTDFLLQHQQDNITLLHRACWQGDLNEVAKLLALKANPNLQSTRLGYSALHFVLLSPLDIEKKKALINLIRQTPNISLSQQDSEDRSILHLAIEQHDVALIQYLLSLDNSTASMRSCLNHHEQDYFFLAATTGSTHVITTVAPFVTLDELKDYFEDEDSTKTFQDAIKKMHAALAGDQFNTIKKRMLASANQDLTVKSSLTKAFKHLEAPRPKSPIQKQWQDLKSTDITTQTNALQGLYTALEEKTDLSRHLESAHDTNNIEVLVRLLSSNHYEVITASARLLASLAELSPLNQTLIRTAGAFPALMNVLRTSDYLLTKKNALSALMNLLKDNCINQDNFMILGGISTLECLLRPGALLLIGTPAETILKLLLNRFETKMKLGIIGEFKPKVQKALGRQPIASYMPDISDTIEENVVPAASSAGLFSPVNTMHTSETQHNTSRLPT